MTSKNKNSRKKNSKANNVSKKRLRICMSCGFFLLFYLIIRIAYFQFIEGAFLKETAVKNQLSNKTLTPHRGTIYDASGQKALAISAAVDTVSVNPTNVKYSNGDEVNKEILAHAFSNIFGLDYNETLEKLNNKTSTFKMAEKVNHEKIEELESWMKENKINRGIIVNEDINRFYPYDNLASNLIGFTGTDNVGLIGLERTLNNILEGTAGKVLVSTDSINGEIPNAEQAYVPVQNGSDVCLTIDVNIQSIAEKYLSQAVSDNNADSGNVIIMNPTNGDILAMANYPNYNLNTPFTITDSKLLDKFNSLSEQEQNDFYYNTLWNNICVQKTYEPGSTFKLITAATALEEQIVSPESPGEFYCSGHEQVADLSVACWRYYNPHGYQSLKEALANSCNPAFIQLGKKIGATTLYKYYQAFGLFNKTNSYFYDEQNSLFFNEKNLNETNLATMSFGQRFNITPIQLITAISSIANEGVLMKPRIVKEIINTDTGAITTIEPTKVRQVVSKETAEQMMDMLEYVVTDGTGKYAKVKGYSVGGKSGTSEPLSGNKNSGYVASFIGVSPTVNSQVVVLVALYHPRGDSHQGGQVAGPVVSQILSEVLPYLGISSNSNTATTSSSKSVSLPDVRNKTISEAKTILKNAGFTVKLSGDEDANTTLITDQVPKPGVLLTNDSPIYLYTDLNNVRTSTTVPNFKGMSSAQALNSARAQNLNLVIDGSRYCYKPRYCISEKKSNKELQFL